MNPQELTQRLEDIKSDILSIYTPNKPLCHKPTPEELMNMVGFDRLDYLRHNIYKGSELRTHTSGFDEIVWTFPYHVDEQIEDDKCYKVWYTYHDAVDPSDMSQYHRVYYIEEVFPNNVAVVSFLRKLLNEID